jgi:hypothetical protein
MRRTRTVGLSIAGLCLALLVAACGGSGSVTGGDGTAPTSTPAAAGNATVQGSVLNGGEGLQVGVVGTTLTTKTDEEGQFALSRVPAGTVTLQFQGSGVNAQLVVNGVQDQKVTTIQVKVSGSNAQMPTAPTCQPDADTFFTGTIDSITGQTFVVGGRTVDMSQVKKIWRGDRRIYLGDLKVGEKIKVWGKLRSDGVVVADEITLMAGEPGDDGKSWIAFSGIIEAVSSSAISQSCVYPVLIVSGKKVVTGAGTGFFYSSGGTYDAAELAVGMKVYVEGYKQPSGSINATLVRR